MGMADSKEHQSAPGFPRRDNNGHQVNPAFFGNHRGQEHNTTTRHQGNNNNRNNNQHHQHQQRRHQHQHRQYSIPEVLLRVFADAPASWGTEPRIVLANQSAYRVSYWVAEEDRKKTRTTAPARHQQIVKSIDMQLNNVGGQTGATNDSGLSREDAQNTTTKATEEEESSSSYVDLEEAVYFLTRDHRMGPLGNTQATKVAFPVDCQDLRVYAFFELDGLWRLYKDKVYSIGMFKKVFSLTSQDANITPYIDRGSSDTSVPVLPPENSKILLPRILESQ